IAEERHLGPIEQLGRVEHQHQDVCARKLALADGSAKVAHVVDPWRIHELELWWEHAIFDDVLELLGRRLWPLDAPAEALERGVFERSALTVLHHVRPGFRTTADHDG